MPKQSYKIIARQLLLKHEGLRLKPYRCTAGKLTIGVGRNLEDNGISKQEAFYLLERDIDAVLSSLIHKFPWFKELNDVRKAVVIDMAFNLGIKGFSNFEKTIEYIAQQEYEKASIEMLDSAWATQVGYRANDLSNLMKNGEYKEI